MTPSFYRGILYAMKPQPPSTAHVVILVGIPGAGKSFFADHFASTFRAPIINSSALAKQLKTDPDTVQDIADILLTELLKTGRTLVYEGSTATKAERAALAKKVESAGYQPLFVWVQTESESAKDRATHKNHEGQRLSASEFAAALAAFQPPTTAEKALVISGKHTHTSQLRAVLKQLVGPRAGSQLEKPAASRNTILR